MFINKDLSYNQTRELFRRREEARQIDTHFGDSTATSLISYVVVVVGMGGFRVDDTLSDFRVGDFRVIGDTLSDFRVGDNLA